MLPRILFLLLMLISGVSSASLLSQQTLPAQYMQTTEDAAIWAQVGNSVINVGNVRAGQILAVVPAAADYYEFRFGFGGGRQSDKPRGGPRARPLHRSGR